MIKGLSNTELYLYISLLIAGVGILLLFFLTKSNPVSIKPSLKEKKESKEEESKDSILEIFDYLGTKIIHENGVYTVNDNSFVQTYSSWNTLPKKYQKMVKELDERSNNKKKNKDDYFLEVINGVYHLTTPDGKQKKYKRLDDIPKHIRVTLGR